MLTKEQAAELVLALDCFLAARFPMNNRMDGKEVGETFVRLVAALTEPAIPIPDDYDYKAAIQMDVDAAREPLFRVEWQDRNPFPYRVMLESIHIDGFKGPDQAKEKCDSLNAAAEAWAKRKP